MGLFNWWRRKRMSDPVDGALLVTVCAQPDTAPEARSYSAVVLGVVSGPGVAAQAVELSCTVPSKRCPTSKQRIPVVVDRADPTRIVIKWNQVPIRKSLAQARSRTQGLAASMRRFSNR
jgi:hypothetical protein